MHDLVYVISPAALNRLFHGEMNVLQQVHVEEQPGSQLSMSSMQSSACAVEVTNGLTGGSCWPGLHLTVSG